MSIEFNTPPSVLARVQADPAVVKGEITVHVTKVDNTDMQQALERLVEAYRHVCPAPRARWFYE